jgi:hypothetical protein
MFHLHRVNTSAPKDAFWDRGPHHLPVQQKGNTVVLEKQVNKKEHSADTLFRMLKGESASK